MQETNYLTARPELIKKLKLLPFLQHIDNKHLTNILYMSKLRSYQCDEVIAEEGKQERFIYIIVYGEVKVEKQGKEITRLNEPGDTFGELAVIDGGTRSATVSAVSNTVCLAIDSSFLSYFPEENQPAFYSVFYRLLCEILSSRLRETNEEIIKLKQQNANLEQENCNLKQKIL